MSGRIDRLVVTPEAVLIADFKTSLPGARAGSRAHSSCSSPSTVRSPVTLYPGRAIRSFLIGLDGPRWLEPADAELDAALSCLEA